MCQVLRSTVSGHSTSLYGFQYFLTEAFDSRTASCAAVSVLIVLPFLFLRRAESMCETAPKPDLQCVGPVPVHVGEEQAILCDVEGVERFLQLRRNREDPFLFENQISVL